MARLPSGFRKVTEDDIRFPAKGGTATISVCLFPSETPRQFVQRKPTYTIDEGWVIRVGGIRTPLRGIDSKRRFII